MSQPFFRDDAIDEGYRFSYYVRAESGAGRLSESSNVVMAPDFAPPVTFEQVRAKLRDLEQQRKSRASPTRARLSRSIAVARAAVKNGRWRRAKRLLESVRQRVERNRRAALDALAAEDLEMMVAKLLRRVKLAESGVIQSQEVLAP